MLGWFAVRSAVESAPERRCAGSGVPRLPDLLALGVRHFRVEFLNETPEQVARAVARYRQLLRGEISGTQLWRELKLFNQLGVTRGQMAGQRG